MDFDLARLEVQRLDQYCAGLQSTKARAAAEGQVAAVQRSGKLLGESMPELARLKKLVEDHFNETITIATKYPKSA
jgi:hypothetical protein